MPKRRKYPKWSTEDEIKFLKRLGHWKGPVYFKKSNSIVKVESKVRPNTKLLKKYKMSMELRENWGNIDSSKLLKFLP